MPTFETNSFDTLLLTAGHGRRLQPITNLIPKCLCPVQGEPILGFWIQKLIQSGADRIGHAQADLVTNYLRTKGWWDRIDWRYEKQLKGTGGTLNTILKEAKPYLKPLFVIHADNYSNIDLRSMYEYHQNQVKHQKTGTEKCLATVSLFYSSRPQHCGIVTRNELGIMTSFKEKPNKPNSNLANAAIYLIEPQRLIESEISLENIQDISLDLMPHFVGRAQTYLHQGIHIDIGHLGAYRDALLSKNAKEMIKLEEYT